MKKLIEKGTKFVKKHDNIFVLILIMILILSKVYNVYISNTDEMYNFFNSYKIANGLTIYKDNNVIITPLFFYIASIFLKIFGENILAFRTYNLIIVSFLFFISYLNLKELKINKRFSLFYTLLIISFTYSIIGGGANYNVLAYDFYLLGLYLLLKMKKSNKKSIIQGLMIFIIYLSYQKLGVAYFCAILIYEIINRDIKSLFKEFITAFILLMLFFIYLNTQNNLYDFLNYTVLGIGEFGNKNIAIDSNILKILLFLILPIMTTVITIIIIKTIKKKLNLANETIIINNMLIILAFSVCAYIIIIPIVNAYHVFLASILTIINLMYIVNTLIEPILMANSIKKIINTIILCIIIILLVSTTKGMIKYISRINDIPKDSPFYGALIDEKLSNTINEVSNYIKTNDKNTILLSTYSSLISLNLNDLDNKDFDLPLRGNLGKDGEKGLIEKIKKLKNTQILLLHETDEEKELYQFAYDVADYIKQNYRYVGQVNKFDIYEIN